MEGTPNGRDRSRSRSREKGDPSSGLTEDSCVKIATANWTEPQIGDPVLVLERRWAELIVSGIKVLELRNFQNNKHKSRIWIAAKAGKEGKSEILGSVCFSHQEDICWDELFSLHPFHCVENAHDFPKGRLVNGQTIIRGWYFKNHEKAPHPLQYRWWTGDNKKGPQTWRKFQGWI